MTRLILAKEEQRRETDMLDIEPHKHVLDRLGEEQATRVACFRHVELPEEEILVEHVEEEKGKAGEAVDDGGDDAVSQGWQQMRRRRERGEGKHVLMTTRRVTPGYSVPQATSRKMYLML